MGKADLDVKHAIISTKEKLPDRFLFTEGVNEAGGDFLFYIFEASSGKSEFPGLKQALAGLLAENSTLANYAEERFERMLEHVNAGLNKLIQAGKADWLGNLNGLIGLVSNKKIYLTQTGKMSGYIFRKGKISSLTDSSAGSDSRSLLVFSDIISGQLSHNDRLLFSNNKLFDHISLDRLRKILEGSTANEACHNLYNNLRHAKVNGINSVMIEACDENEPVSSSDDDMIESSVYYLDQVEETPLSKIGKFLAPKVKSTYESLSKQSKVAGSAIKKHGGEVYRKSKNSWEKNVGPKTKEFIKKNNHKLSTLVSGKSKPVIETESNHSAGKGQRGFKAVYYRRESTFLTNAIDWLKNAWLVVFSLLRKKEARKYLYLALIVIFLSAGYAKIRYNNTNRDKIKASQDASVAYDDAKAAFDKAKEDKALGRTVDLAVFENALALAEKGEAISVTADKSTALAQEIQLYIDGYTKMTRFYPGKMGNISLGNSVQKMVAVGNAVYAIESDGKVYLVNPEDQSNRLVASIGKDKGTVTNLKFDDGKSKVYILTSSNAILSLDTKTNTIGEETADGGWQKANALATFSSNLYLLNPEAGSIYKYASSSTTFGAGSLYADARKADMKGAIDIAIDGNIFVLLPNGNAAKFSRGVKDTSFGLTGIIGSKSTIAEPKKLFTNPDSSYLYVLDTKENRIIRFDKSGNFSIQYTVDGKTIDDFSINDKIKRIWISSGNTVYESDL